MLKDFSIRIRSGECVALVGETGGGKSTVAKLLCRFYEPTSGSIRIDGVDYRRRSLHWLQSSLGIVLQEPHLFSGTIRENIRYGRLTATDFEIEAVADNRVSSSSRDFRMDTRRKSRRAKSLICRRGRSSWWRWRVALWRIPDSGAR